MDRLIRLLGAWAALAVALALPLAPAAQAAGSASPPAGPAGTRFHFTFSGFEPGERVDAWVTAPNSRSYPRYPSITADPAGMAIWSYDIPPDAVTGVWTAAAVGVNSDATDSATFIVTSATATTPEQSVEPAQAAAGTTFRFRVAGFAAGERVGAWLIQPDGKSRELSDKVFWAFADASGVLEWVWESPADAPPGAWQAVAEGISSRYQAVIGFTVLPGGVAPPARGISPTSGGPGTTFNVVVGGFTPGERVGTWLNEPGGARHDSQSPWLLADDNGEARWQWTAPADVPSGRWQAVSQGVQSGVEVVLEFELSGTSGPPPAPPTGPYGTVTPDRGPPGTTFRFDVAGFEPGETIVYFAENPDRTPQEQRTTAVADANGAASWEFTPPIDPATRVGAWHMSAYGETSRRELVVGFMVTAPDARPATVTPTSGGPGTVFRFSAEGFARKEQVGTWVNAPGGRVIEGPRGLRATEDGFLSWEWTAPDDVVAGSYEMIAEGFDTKVLLRINFTIDRDGTPSTLPASVSPERGPPGTVFTFVAGGYKPDERVGYWLNDPEGTIYRFDEEAKADAEGLITVSIAFPDDPSLPRGLWTFVARSSQSDDVINDVTHVIRFVLE